MTREQSLRDERGAALAQMSGICERLEIKGRITRAERDEFYRLDARVADLTKALEALRSDGQPITLALG